MLTFLILFLVFFILLYSGFYLLGNRAKKKNDIVLLINAAVTEEIVNTTHTPDETTKIELAQEPIPSPVAKPKKRVYKKKAIHTDTPLPKKPRGKKTT